MNCMQRISRLHGFLAMIAVTLGQTFETNRSDNLMSSDGNLMSIILMPISEFKNNPEYGLLITEVAKYANIVGNQQLKIWLKETDLQHLNVTFGYKILDSSFAKRKTMDDLMSTVLDKNIGFEREQERICLGYVGNITNDFTLFAMQLLLPFEYPLVSLSLNSAARNPKDYPQYYRMSGIADWMLYFMAMVLDRYDWRYVGLISSDNSYGQEGRYKIIENLKKFNTCLALDTVYDANEELRTLRDVLERDKYLRVIILWLSVDELVMFLEKASLLQSYNITWITGPDMIQIPQYSIVNINPEVLHGILVITPISGNDEWKSDLTTLFYPEFQEYFWNLTPKNTLTNSWLQLFYEKYKVEISDNTTLSKFKSLFQPAFLGVINRFMRAQRTYQHIVWEALRSTNSSLKSLKENILKRSIGYLEDSFFWPRSWINAHSYSAHVVNALNNSNKIEDGGSMFKLHKLAVIIFIPKSFFSLSWSHVPGPIWAGHSYDKPDGKCSKSCLAGKYPLLLRGQTCCWECIDCPEWHYKSSAGQSLCRACPLHSRTNVNRTGCLYLQDFFVTYVGTTAQTTYILQAIGIFLSLTVLVIFLTHYNSSVVKSSVRNLSILQFLLHLGLYVTPLSTLGPVTRFKCCLQPVFFGSFLIAITGIIYIKVDYITIIFTSNVRLPNKTVSKQQSKHFLHLLMLVVLQIITFTIHDQQIPVYIHVEQHWKSLENQISCANGYHFTSQYIVITILLIICSIKAYKVRKLPIYFNDSQSILYTVFCTILIIVASPVVYHNQTRVDEKILVLNVAILLTNTVILSVMYGYKIWIICFHRDKNTNKAVVGATFAIMKKRVSKEMSNSSRSTSVAQTTSY